MPCLELLCLQKPIAHALNPVCCKAELSGAGLEGRQPSQDTRPGIGEGNLVGVKAVLVVVEYVKIIVKRGIDAGSVRVMREVAALGHFAALRCSSLSGR